jgi:hypothetical protein
MLARKASLALLAFEADTLGDVADRRRHEVALLGLDRRQRDFRGKLRTVAAQRRQLDAGAHGPGLGVVEVTAAVLRVDLPCLLRHEDLDQLAEQLVALVAEQPLGLRVDQRDPAGGVDGHDRVRRGLQHRPPLGLLAARPRDVPRDRGGTDRDAVPVGYR